MPLKPIKQEAAYKPNQSIVKIIGYGDNHKIQITTIRCLRTSGLELPEPEAECKYIRCSVNDEKLSQSVSRARSKIFELAFCNPWDYFFTGTVSSGKCNREDLDKIHKDFSKWIVYLNAKYQTKIAYLIIPELHSDGKSWHFHGLIKGIPQQSSVCLQKSKKIA